MTARRIRKEEGHFDEKILEKYNTPLVDTDTEEEEEDVKDKLVVDYRSICPEILPHRSIFITCHICSPSGGHSVSTGRR